MAAPRKRRIPGIPNYKGNDPHLKDILEKIQLALKHIVEDDFITEKDIYCKDLITAEKSIYIGPKVYNNKLENISHDLYWNKIKITGQAGGAGLVAHASDHQSGGVDAINHNLLAGYNSDEHVDIGNMTVNVRIPFSMYDPSPGRGSESNVHGGLLALATGQPLDSVPTDLPVSQGIGKLVIVINAGSDVSGTITVTGDTIDRNTGAKSVADTDTITVDAVTTDNSDTDTNGNTRHAFTGAYITSKWFTGSVVLSTADLTLTDVDVYHVSFEQFGDQSGITLDQFDANIFATNVAAEFDAYLYSLQVTGDKCDIAREADLNVGADGETAIANKYYRLKKTGINTALDGTTDGFWVDIHYSNSPAYVEDVTLKVWYILAASVSGP